MLQESKNNQNDREVRERKNSEWTLNRKQFDHSKTQEISHILPGEQLNVFNGEESVSYLQLPVKKKEENRFCTRCGEMGHGQHYCQVNTWCKFCITDTHATQACRKSEKFVKDNPIVSSRRNTLVQVQGQRAAVNPQERPQQPLFPHPPVQCYDPTVIPQMAMHNLTPQDEEHESREHSRKSPQNQMEEVRTPMLKQLPHQDREDRGWYKNKCNFREHSQNSQEISPQRREYSKKETFNQPSGMRTANNSEYSDSSQNLHVLNNYSKEPENDKTNQQPSVIRGSFTQMMVNLMQLQDHKFTAWLDRLVEARKNRQERRQRPYRNFRKPYNDGKQNGDTGSKPPLRNRIKPAQELEIQQIMDNFNCEYDDVVKAVDLYNLDVEECTTT